MCLYKLLPMDSLNGLVKKEGGHNVSAKYLKSINGHLYFVYWGIHKRIPVGKWINEKDFRAPRSCNTIVSDDHNKRYPTGFHHYPFIEIERENKKIESGGSIPSGRVWRKIYFRQAVQAGRDFRGKAIVSKEIFIVPLKKRRKK